MDSTERVIVCEALPALRTRVVDRLHALGYTTVEVETPAEAIERIAAAEETVPFELALVGIDALRDPDVVGCAREMTESARIPIVFFVSREDMANGVKAAAIPWAGIVEIDAGETAFRATLQIARSLHTARIAAAAREEWFRTTVDSIAEGVVVADINGRITSINRVAAALTGWSEDAAVGRPLGDTVRLSLRGRPVDFSRRLSPPSDDLFTINDEMTLLSRDGREFPVAGSIAPIAGAGGAETGTVVVVRDVTREQSILDRLEKTLLVATDGTWDWNLVTDEVSFDPRYYTMVGYEVDEFPHRLEEFRERIHPDDVESVFRAAQLYLVGELDTFRVEFRFRRKSGGWTWIMGRGLVVDRDGDGAPLRFVGTHTDITDRVEKERKIAALLDEQLRLVKEVQHRIKNHMYLMMSMLSLQASSVESEETKAALSDAAGRFTSMSVLYERLYRSEHPAGITVREYLEALIAAIVGAYPTPCPVSIESGIEEFESNEREMPAIGMIVNELLTNALKHAFDSRSAGVVEVRVGRSGEKRQIVVADDGVGLPPDVSPNEPRSFGFRMVDALADQLGGEITLDRRDGSGTSITITF